MTHPRSDQVHDTWYSARTPDGKLWVEARDPQEFREQCAFANERLTLRKHTTYICGTSEIITEPPK